MESTLNSCSIGDSLHESCHATKFTRKRGLKTLIELEDDGKNILQICCDHLFTPEDTICFHHKQMYIYKYWKKYRHWRKVWGGRGGWPP